MEDEDLKKFKCEFLEDFLKLLKPLVESFKSHVDNHDQLVEDYLIKNNLLVQVEKSKDPDSYRYIG